MSSILGPLTQLRHPELDQIVTAQNFKALPVIGDRKQREASGGVELGRTIFFGRTPEWVLPVAMVAVWTNHPACSVGADELARVRPGVQKASDHPARVVPLEPKYRDQISSH